MSERKRTERLSASDMSSLLAERGPIHVHVGATILVEGEPPELDAILELPDLGIEKLVVCRIGKSPLPGDARPCVFAQPAQTGD